MAAVSRSKLVEPGVRPVELSLETGVRSRQSFHHLSGPFKVLPLTFHTPIRWRGGQYGPQIGYLVSQLDPCRPLGLVRRIADLQSLTGSLRQRFVVRDFRHQASHVIAEALPNLIHR